MNDRVGNISFPVKRSSELGKKPYSDKLALIIDEEVRMLVAKAFKRTQKIIDSHQDKLVKVRHDDVTLKGVFRYLIARGLELGLVSVCGGNGGGENSL